MSADNEWEIRGRLGAALDTITPSSPPVEEVARRGRAIRVRRRAAVAAGLAVVVGLGVALPGLVGHAQGSPPVQHSYQVTVNPTQDTPRQLTFSGTINGQPWRFELDWNRGNVVGRGPGTSLFSMRNISPQGQPAVFDEMGSGARRILAGVVRADVSYLTVNQPGGQAVDVTPARWHGQRWVGVAIPASQRLRSVVAYSDRGEVAYAVPFGDTVNVWLKPGQHGLARQTARIATGAADGKRWSFEGFAGPWGICLGASAGNASCLQAYGSRLRPGHVISWLGCGALDGTVGQLWNGQAAPGVSYLKFRLSGGSARRVAPATLAGYRYFAVAFGQNQQLTGWTAYGASGQVLGRGPGLRNC